MAWYDSLVPFSKKGQEFYKKAWSGTDPEIITKEMWDPLKKPVATPMSQFLAAEVGKGLPRYEGKLYEGLDPMAESRYSEFMGMDPGAWFEQAVAGPETKRFKEEMLPEITEGFAGALRGSGRFKAEEAGISQFSEFLAQERAKAIPAITSQQFEMGVTRAGIEDVGRQREYADWMKSLPEYNPVLDKALDFLAGPTGRDVIAMGDPGQKGWLQDLVKIVATYAGAKGGA